MKKISNEEATRWDPSDKEKYFVNACTWFRSCKDLGNIASTKLQEIMVAIDTKRETTETKTIPKFKKRFQNQITQCSNRIHEYNMQCATNQANFNIQRAAYQFPSKTDEEIYQENLFSYVR